jgi:hypothetical protein
VALAALAAFEEQRADLTARCWPAGGLRGGRSRAELRLNLTFDASGREIARGIMENRRAPSGELTSCLRKLRGTGLRVPPPGTIVAVTLPVTFP